MKRREFAYKFTMGGLALTMGRFSDSYMADDVVRLTILHTNDVHSRIDPFPMDGGRNEGRGGAARRAAMIKKIRAKEPHVLLLDAGDILQGTPYFNVFKGELEFELMDRMAYDAATIGNHDFDGGAELLAQRIQESTFSMLNCNYLLEDSPLKGLTQPHKIFSYDGIKVGVLGVGIALKGLVPESLTAGAVYTDPIKAANAEAELLKQELGCDYVICLSHLGLYYRDGTVSDQVLAKNSRNIDFIIGGHTHSFMRDPDVHTNLDGAPVMINQVGFGGLLLGRIDVTFERSGKSQCTKCSNEWVQAWKSKY